MRGGRPVTSTNICHQCGDTRQELRLEARRAQFRLERNGKADLTKIEKLKEAIAGCRVCGGTGFVVGNTPKESNE